MKLYQKRKKLALGGLLGKLGNNPQAMQGIGGLVQGLNQSIPDQTTTGGGKIGKNLGKEIGGAVGSAFGVPFVKEGLGVLDTVGNAITGDGTDTARTVIGNTLNPLSTFGSLSEGRVTEAIPIAGGFIKAARLRGEEQKRLEEQYNKNSTANIQRSNSILAGYPTQGVQSSQMFGKYGMKLSYATGGLIPQSGGDMQPISSTGAMVVGNTHEQGGVKMDNNGQPIELEGGEGVHTLPNGEQLVSSNSLPSPNPVIDEAGQIRLQTIAEEMLRLEVEKGKFEKLAEKRPLDSNIKNVLAKLDKEITALAQEQEAMMGREQPMQEQQTQPNLDAMASEMSMNPQEYGGQMMKYGGKLYDKGGPINSLFRKPIFPLPSQIPNTATVPINGGGFGNAKSIMPIEIAKIDKIFGNIDTSKLNSSTSLSNPQDVSNLVAKSGSSNIPNVAPYIDNISNVIINQQRAGMTMPRQKLDNYLNPRLVNFDNQRAEANRQLRGYNNNIMFSNSNSATSNAALAAGLAGNIRARNEINSNEMNTNQGILSNNDLVNSQIQGRNNQTTYRDDAEGFKFKESLLAKTSENVADLSKDIQTQQRDKKAESIYAQQQKMQFTVLDDDKKLAMYEQYPDIVNQIAPEWIAIMRKAGKIK